MKLIILEFIKEANNLNNIAAKKSQFVIWSVGRHSPENTNIEKRG